MDRKGNQSTETVAVQELKVRLAKGASVTAEEERTVRMRHGVTVERTAPLARAAGSNAELGDELLFMEMQLMRAQQQRSRLGKPALAAVPSPTKSKIVRALRKKK